MLAPITTSASQKLPVTDQITMNTRNGIIHAMSRIIALFALFVVAAVAQGAYFPGQATTVRAGNVAPVPYANVYVCASGVTCSSTSAHVTVYSDAALTQAITQPIVADAYGNFGFYAAPFAYVYNVSGRGIQAASYPITLPPACDGNGNCSAKSFEQVRYADQFSGADFCAKINAAALDAQSAGLPAVTVDATGFTSSQSCGTDPFSGITIPIVLRLGNITISDTANWTVATHARIEGGAHGATVINYTPISGAFITWSVVPDTGLSLQRQDGIYNVTMNGPGHTSTAVGLQLGTNTAATGGTNPGASGESFQNVVFRNWGTGTAWGRNSYSQTFINCMWEGDGKALDYSPVVDGGGNTNSGEMISFFGGFVADSDTPITWGTAGFDFTFSGTSLDYNTNSASMTAGGHLRWYGGHWENNGLKDYLDASAGTVDIDGTYISSTAASGTWPQYITASGSANLSLAGNRIASYGSTLTQAVNFTSSGILSVMGDTCEGNCAHIVVPAQVLTANKNFTIDPAANEATLGMPIHQYGLSLLGIGTEGGTLGGIAVGNVRTNEQGIQSYAFGTQGPFLTVNPSSNSQKWLLGTNGTIWLTMDGNGVIAPSSTATLAGWTLTGTTTNSGSIIGGTINATTLQQGGVNAALQGVDINASNQVTATHLGAPLPTAQGGTGVNSTATFPGSGTVAVTSQLPLSGTTASIGGSALVAGACSSGTVTVTGATTSMVAEADPTTYPGDGAEWAAYVSAANTVTVKVCAIVALTPTASTYNVRVIQ